jgi:hypothetical protein
VHIKLSRIRVGMMSRSAETVNFEDGTFLKSDTCDVVFMN